MIEYGEHSKKHGNLFVEVMAVRKDWKGVVRLWLGVSIVIQFFTPRILRRVSEAFWIDLVVENPLDTDINLTHFTITVEEDTGTSEPLVDVDVIEVTLTAKERKNVKDIYTTVISAEDGSLQVSISIMPLRPAPLVISHVTYEFLSLLPSSESLSYRGRRLYTATNPTYAPDVVLKVAVVDLDYRLAVRFIEDELLLLQGEYKDVRVLLSNTGTKPITEIWIVADVADDVWLSGSQGGSDKGMQVLVRVQCALTMRRCIRKRNSTFCKLVGTRRRLSDSGSRDGRFTSPTRRQQRSDHQAMRRGLG